MDQSESDLARLMRVVTRKRMAKKWTNNHLADLAGISGVYLGDMEKGKGKRPGVQIVAKIARALGTTTDALLIDAGLMDPPKGWSEGRANLEVVLGAGYSLREEDISAITHLVARLAETPAAYDVNETIDWGKGYNAASNDELANEELRRRQDEERGEPSAD